MTADDPPRSPAPPAETGHIRGGEPDPASEIGPRVEALLTRAAERGAERGARRALADVGLEGKEAALDIHDLRHARRREEADVILLDTWPRDLRVASGVAPADPQFASLVISVSASEIAEIRDAFREIGFEPGTTVGKVDRQAVLDFQRHYGLTVDGLIGRQTLSSLQRELDARRKSKQGGAGVAGGGAVAGGNEAVAPDPSLGPGIVGYSWITAGGIAVAAIALLFLLTLAWHYRDLIAARIQRFRPGSPAGCARSEPRRPTMWTILAGPLANAGLNILGGRSGPVVTTVGSAVLKELGVTSPEQAVRKIEADPEAIARLDRLEAERGPEWAAVALAEQRTAELLADRESEQGGFAFWWRPGGMYLNLYLWLQNTMLTPVLFNGVLKLQVPMIPREHLIASTALYCGLYMGGHTVKAMVGAR